MEKKIKFIKIAIVLIIALILVKIFFSYSLNMTWDSSEYIGLASFVGTEKMRNNWIAHRGIGFPWLINLTQIFGGAKALLSLMFVFYAILILSNYLIYKKLKKIGVLKNKIASAVFIGFVTIFIFLNPMIFGYYHTVLTEFVGITLITLTSVLVWLWSDYTWEENKLRNNYVYDFIFSYNNFTLSYKTIFSCFIFNTYLYILCFVYY